MACLASLEAALGKGFWDAAALDTSWPEELADKATPRMRPDTRRIRKYSNNRILTASSGFRRGAFEQKHRLQKFYDAALWVDFGAARL